MTVCIPVCMSVCMTVCSKLSISGMHHEDTDFIYYRTCYVHDVSPCITTLNLIHCKVYGDCCKYLMK